MANANVQTAANDQELSSVQFLTVTAIFVALTYIFTAFINVRLPIAANGGLIHLGNVPLFIGAIIFVLIPELGRGLSAYAPFLTGICTLIVAYLLPGGLAGIPALIRNRREQKAKEAANEGRDQNASA